MKLRGVVSLMWVMLSLAAIGADWPQFRGPFGSAVSPGKGFPVKWSPTENIRWKAPLPGRGLSCPVIAGGRVYLTANSGIHQDRLHVLCFDLETGKQLWERTFWCTGSTTCHTKTCMAAPTPVTDGERVFALFATGDLFCLNKDGELLWYRALAKDYPGITNNVGMAASPVLFQDTLFLPLENAGDSFAAGLDARTGVNRWKVERHRDINWVTPLVVQTGNQAEVIFQTAKEVTAYDPQTGQRKWTHEAGLSSVSSPTLGDGTILIAGGEYTALKAGNDSAAPEVVWKSKRIKTGYTSAVHHKGRIYSMDGAVLVCSDAADGKELWRHRLKGAFSASPVIAEDRLYVVNEDGTTFVVAISEKPETLSENRLDEPMLATPALSGGKIFLRSDKHLFCVEQQR